MDQSDNDRSPFSDIGVRRGGEPRCAIERTAGVRSGRARRAAAATEGIAARACARRGF
jgi:hypothetical protein